MDKVLLRNGVLIGLEPLKLERGDLLIEDGRVRARGVRLEADDETEVIDCRGRFVMPGLVNAHARLHSSQTLGMPRLEEMGVDPIYDGSSLQNSHTAETIVTSSFAGALDAIRLGTTTVLDLHASPQALEGSLDLVRDVVLTVGLRCIASYESSAGEGFAAALAENDRFLTRAYGEKVQGLCGLGPVELLDDEALAAAAVAKSRAQGLHLEIAQRADQVEEARQRFGKGSVLRLAEAGLLGPGTLLAHGVHLEEAERQAITEAGAWIVHCPSANARRGVGQAPFENYGDLVALGSDGHGNDMLAEARSAYTLARSRGAQLGAEDVIRLLVGSQQLASELLGCELGTTNHDAAADFVILRYHPNTPMTDENLADHLVFGIGPENIEAVMVDGNLVYRDGRFREVDTRRLRPLIRKGAKALWEAAGGKQEG